MKTTRFARSGTAQRGAYTLIELMVVITIIVALMALTASAVLKFIEVQQNTNTQSTLDRVQSQLARAWSKVKDQAKKETPPPTILPLLAGTDTNAGERAKVINVKLKLRQAFPMNFGEALNVPYQNPELAAWGLPTLVPSSPLPALPGYFSYLTSQGITAAMVMAQPAPQPYESAVCLLMALQRGVSGAGIDPAELTTGGAAGTITTATGGTLQYLNDAWGRPIFFSRFPTGSMFLNPAGALAGNNDPGDPLGYLNSPYWQTLAPQQTLFSQLTLQKLAPPNTPSLSYKLAPMIASGGPVNWTKPGTPLTLDPLTFAPGYFTLPGGPFVPSPDAGSVFSTP